MNVAEGTVEEEAVKTKIERIKNMTAGELLELLEKHGLKPTMGQVDFMTKFVDKVNEDDFRIINDKICVRMYDVNGKFYLYKHDALRYQFYAFKRVMNLVNHGLFSVELAENPATHRMIKYLCLNI